MINSDVPNADVAAHADPPPGVGDAEANAARTSRSDLSAIVAAMDVELD
jgi:hypothetical protein